MRYLTLAAGTLLAMAVGGCGYSGPPGYYAQYPNSYSYQYRPYYAPNYGEYFTDPSSRGGNG